MFTTQEYDVQGRTVRLQQMRGVFTGNDALINTCMRN